MRPTPRGNRTKTVGRCYLTVSPGSAIAGPQSPAWVRSRPTAELCAPGLSTSSPLGCERVLDTSHSRWSPADAQPQGLSASWTPSGPGPVWSWHSGRTGGREGTGHMPGSGGGVRPWPKLQGLRSGNGYPETCCGGGPVLLEFEQVGRMEHQSPQEERGPGYWNLREPKAQWPLLQPLPSSTGEASPAWREQMVDATSPAPPACPSPHRLLLGPSDQSQFRPPWCQAGTGPLPTSDSFEGCWTAAWVQKA